MAPHPTIAYSIFPAMLVIFYPPKTEYEIETKETMQREQKVIVLKTVHYCKVLCEDKRLLNWVSNARERHLKEGIFQNFPCGAGRGKPPPPPSPSPASSLRRHRSSFFLWGKARTHMSHFLKKIGFTFPSFTGKVKKWHTPFIEIRAVWWRYELWLLSNGGDMSYGCSLLPISR